METIEPIKLLFSGDLCPQLRVEQACISGQANSLYDVPLRSVLKDKDLSVTNLECPLTRRGRPIVKSGPALGCHPKAISALTSGYFDVAALANNHILDQGDPGSGRYHYGLRRCWYCNGGGRS